MAKPTTLTAAEFAGLVAVDGTHHRPPMISKIKDRLLKLFLIERREWPGGPLWRTLEGNRRVKVGK